MIEPTEPNEPAVQPTSNSNRNLFNRVKVLQTVAMSSSKKKNAPLPASSAGLLRFFEDETKGVKIRPELVLGIAGGIIGVSILIRLIFPV
jgi:preprotein translocase subunit Sec61beta